MPTTTAGEPAPSAAGRATISARIPATLPTGSPDARSTSRTSFGHLTMATHSSARSSRRGPNTSTNATAMHEVTSMRRSTGQPGLSSTEKSRLVPGGASQRRSRRPRPAVWWSVLRTRPSGSPAEARPTRSALVEPVSATVSTRKRDDQPDPSRSGCDEWSSSPRCVEPLIRAMIGMCSPRS